jgi:RNA polymerase primary sigma factor
MKSFAARTEVPEDLGADPGADLGADVGAAAAGRLSAEEERALGRQIRASEAAALAALGDRADRWLRGLESRKQQLEAIRQAVEALRREAGARPSLLDRAGQACGALRAAERQRWRLAMSAADLARQEARRHVGPFLSEEDLVQEAYIGLLHAARRWDPERGIRFRIYARWWVRAQLSRTIDHHGRPIRLPTNAADTLRKLRDARDRRRWEGLEAGVDSLAEEIGVDRERAEELLGHGYTVSLEAPVERPGGRPRTLASTLADGLPTPDIQAARAEQRARLKHAVERVLTDQQRLVMVRRYGLEDGRFRTLSEVGSELGLSRERIRQIERLALQRIRRRCEAPLKG